jgi:uncharacterized protein (TIGR00369 family)
MVAFNFPAIQGVELEPVNYASHTPMGAKIGLHYLAIGEARIGTGLAYDARLVGKAQTGVLHGGAVTALIDETAGGAIVNATGGSQAVATVDLRIDYMRPAEPGQPLYCLAHCYRTTRRIAFFRAEAFHTPDRPVALGTGTFMLGANDTRPGLLGSLRGNG